MKISMFCILNIFLLGFAYGEPNTFKSGNITDKNGRSVGTFTETKNSASETTTIKEKGGNTTKYRKPLTGQLTKTNKTYGLPMRNQGIHTYSSPRASTSRGSSKK